MLGALASVYGKEGGGTDTAVWLAGSKEMIDPHLPGIGPSSMAHQTIEALREAGVLDDIVVTKAGMVIYPSVKATEGNVLIDVIVERLAKNW